MSFSSLASTFLCLVIVSTSEGFSLAMCRSSLTKQIFLPVGVGYLSTKGLFSPPNGVFHGSKPLWLDTKKKNNEFTFC